MQSRSTLRKRLRLALVAGILAALGGLFLPVHSNSQMPVIRFVKNPDPAPAFKVKDLDGKEVTVDAYKGKVVLLNFWATWCGPCRAEIPSLIELQKKYKDQMQILGMNVDDDDETQVRAVVQGEGINYPVALTPPDVRMEYGGISALPTVFIINTEGRVVQKHVGLFNPALYETEVRALLGMPVAVRVESFEDTGQVFLKHADRAEMFPGVDLASLNTEQRALAIKKFNAEGCTCGCKMTLAQCRIYDAGCSISLKRTAEIVKEVAAIDSKPGAAAPTPAAPPSSPN
ncbi:MAG TPA: TlpA disulfide reductase family protein [Candidatus Saccharimonadales bacterium]|nr:TlpA disulfide reductase family protein [Candidatus Saccharimonadales bacterium]